MNTKQEVGSESEPTEHLVCAVCKVCITLINQHACIELLYCFTTQSSVGTVHNAEYIALDSSVSWYFKFGEMRAC